MFYACYVLQILSIQGDSILKNYILMRNYVAVAQSLIIADATSINFVTPYLMRRL